MTDDLKQLDAAAQFEFNHRRKSASVIQVKCTSCGAWYETPRGSVDKQESFVCEGEKWDGPCGNPITYVVPAIENAPKTLIPATNEDLLNIGDIDARLDTGMTIKEALALAEHWWNKTGQKEMKSQLKRQSEAVGGSNKGLGGAFLSENPDSPNFMPSAILLGRPWHVLSKIERLKIVKICHHFFVREPDLIGKDDPEAKHQMQDRLKIN